MRVEGSEAGEEGGKVSVTKREHRFGMFLPHSVVSPRPLPVARASSSMRKDLPQPGGPETRTGAAPAPELRQAASARACRLRSVVAVYAVAEVRDASARWMT